MKRDEALGYVGLAIALLSLVGLSVINMYKRDDLEKRIDKLEGQVIELETENEFLKENYEEQVIVLDSKLIELETKVVEMEDGVELIKK